MRTRQLGSTGPVVSEVGLGCMAMSDVYGPADRNEGIATIHAALDAGITLLDTGDFYAMGANEMLVRDAIAQRDRGSLQLSVKFALGKSATAIGAADVTLDDGTKLPANFVVIGIGVQPNLDLAKQMGLAVDNGVVVNEFLESSSAGIYAAGDIASFPYRTGDRVRVEHFVVAERQGQFAAENILGARKKYDDIPYFWTVHFGTEIRYVGHASKADDIVVGGSIEKGDALVAYKEKGRQVAFASLGRDLACLMAERALETDDVQTMDELTAR
jgi:NADPH-dependent 2,4-dienoyl-CoA reductase/sulfur reductase-like enzyme